MKKNINTENNFDQILIAEDSVTQAEQLKYILEKHKYNVLVAKNGKEALGMVIKHKPSLVISDIVMPEMDGYELCKEIKLNESTMEIPVILLTSLTRSEDVLEGISCGADNFITKPYREDYLISHIKQILANKNIYKNERVRIGVEIILGGKRRFITASQQQMLTLLLSTYEAAVQRNDELVQTQDDLKKLNEHLEELVIERTAELSAENSIRKRAEKRIKKLNRVYAVLSNINQTIVRIHNIQHLLNDACLIAVDEGKFQSAWIGILDNQTKKIETFATAGLANNLIKVSPDQNPILNIIRSGKHFVSNNINDDKNLTDIWKQNSMKLGFRSFAVFPLIVFGKTIGGFSIYSNEIDFFDAQEISLLDEMATDISFALEYIQTESEGKKAEELLQKLNKAIRNSREVIFMTDKQGTITFVNPEFTKMYGFTDEEVIGKNTLRILESGLFNREEYEQFWDALLNKQSFFGQYINKGKDGKLIDVEASVDPILDDNGEIIGFLGIQRDITARKRIEEEIISQKNRFLQLFENSPIAIALLDDQDKIVHINESFSVLFGYFLEEVKGESLNDFIVPTELKEEAESYSDQTRAGNQINKESYRKKKDGTLVYVQIVGIPVTVNDKTVGIYGMYVDLTQRKEAEEKMKLAKELAESSDKLKSEFLNQMSHEIRTPINIILGNTDYLNNSFGEKMDSDARDCFDGIDLASKRIIRTVDLILNAAELQTSGYKPQLVKIDLDFKILSKLYKEHELFAKQKGLEIIYTCKEKDSNIIADEFSITQIFANLIDNAIKYTKKGKVEILLVKNNTGNIMVEIKDTGIGMKKEFLSRMFEPFVQEEQGYTRAYDGNGLGLSLVKNYCDINNAVIEVESEKNVGSTFRVIFNKNSGAIQ